MAELDVEKLKRRLKRRIGAGMVLSHMLTSEIEEVIAALEDRDRLRAAAQALADHPDDHTYWLDLRAALESRDD